MTPRRAPLESDSTRKSSGALIVTSTSRPPLKLREVAPEAVPEGAFAAYRPRLPHRRSAGMQT